PEGRFFQERGGLGHEQRQEREPVLDSAENRRRAEEEREHGPSGEPQLEQLQGWKAPPEEIPQQAQGRRGRERYLRQGKRDGEDRERIDDGKRRRAQLATEVVPGVMDVMGMESDPVAQVLRRTVPEERPRREENDRGE